MSYSFSVQAPSKAEVLSKVEAELARVVDNQPIHAADQQQAQAAAAAFVALMPDDATKDVYVSVSGSISWTGLRDQQTVTHAACSVSAGLKQRVPAEPAAV